MEGLMKIGCLLLVVGLSGCSLLVPGNDGLTPDLGSDAGYDAGPQRDAGRDAGPPRDAGPGAPDLTIACGTPADIVQSGDIVRVPWTASNIGIGPAQPFTVAVLMEM